MSKNNIVSNEKQNRIIDELLRGGEIVSYGYDTPHLNDSQGCKVMEISPEEIRYLVNHGHLQRNSNDFMEWWNLKF
jgi:hypothetical protein